MLLRHPGLDLVGQPPAPVVMLVLGFVRELTTKLTEPPQSA